MKIASHFHCIVESHLIMLNDQGSYWLQANINYLYNGLTQTFTTYFDIMLDFWMVYVHI